MSHDGDKSDKNSLLINDQHDYNLNIDSYSFNTGISLLRVAYFNNYLNDFVGVVEINLEITLTVFIQIDQINQIG